MTTLPTPEQLVISGLNYFLNANKDVNVGERLARIRRPECGSYREPDGICFYVKVNLWWHELPNYHLYQEQAKLCTQAEDLIDELIKPYISNPESDAYLSDKGILTEERLQVVAQLLSKLQEQQGAKEQQNATTN